MPRPIGVDLRERAVRAYESGAGTFMDVAAQFGVCRKTLQNWVARKRATGDVAASEPAGGRTSHVDMDALVALIAERPDVTTLELTVQYNRRVQKHHRAHRSSVLRALYRAGYVFKKNGLVRQSKTGRT